MSIVEFDNILYKLSELDKPINDLEKSLNLNFLRDEVLRLENLTQGLGFWDDTNNSQKIIEELNQFKSKIENFENLVSKRDELKLLVEMGIEEQEISLVDEALDLLNDIEKSKDSLWLESLLNGKYDNENAVLTLHAGAGGTESCDWVSMLYRMYSRWASDKGYGLDVLDMIDGEEAGIKSITFEVSGLNAYGYLKAEQGIHRLVRISPFNANGKRQTSFASLDVMPDIDKDIDLDIPEDDLRIDVYRSSGAGGQHVNKTSSAIRITHIPTNIVVQCQNERSQHMNKDKAMQILKSKLLLLKEEEHAENLSQIRGEVKEINFGSQIRSYVLQPYTMVKDHRTGIEIGNASKVLDGDLDEFINGFLINQNSERK